MGQPDPRHGFASQPPSLRSVGSLKRQSETDILLRRQIRHEVERLEDKPHGGSPIERSLVRIHLSQLMPRDTNAAIARRIEAAD